MNQNLHFPSLLVIEDDDIDFKAFMRVIQRKRIANKVFRAEDGREGLELLDKVAAEGGPFLILLDLNTPRMNGHEFLENLRKNPHHKSAVVFIFTTSDDVEDIKKGYQQNVAGYFLKDDGDESIEELVEVLNGYWQIAILPQG